MPLEYVKDMPDELYIRWRAYFKWKAVQKRHAQDVANMRAARAGR